jgi:hypothetical protein
MNGEHVIEAQVTQVKVEHVGEVLRRLQGVRDSLLNEGLDIGFNFSVERDRDGVERWHEWVDPEGDIKDIQPWEMAGYEPGR